MLTPRENNMIDAIGTRKSDHNVSAAKSKRSTNLIVAGIKSNRQNSKRNSRTYGLEDRETAGLDKTLPIKSDHSLLNEDL